MKMLMDFFPIVLFFIAFKLAGIYGCYLSTNRLALFQTRQGRAYAMGQPGHHHFFRRRHLAHP